MLDHGRLNLCHDAIHGYIPFTARGEAGEVTEREIIDHPWLQRLRQIHQLQTAWWVFPTAEHTRFQHVIGVMHLASRAASALYDSLKEHCDSVPSRGYIEALLRMAGLLHDVGHGPFGHFFDEHFLSRHGLTHETLGAQIIREELAGLLERIRRTPNAELAASERLDPDQVAWLITRPRPGDDEGRPAWLRFLRGLLSGIYTIDNMDFVLRDAYMSGYSLRSYDLDRLLHYTFFSESGLTIHDRGVEALVRFMGARAELFRSVYFHRTVRAIDLSLADLFPATMPYLFPGSPAERLGAYRELTETSLMVDVSRWHKSEDETQRQLGEKWREILGRHIPWLAVCQRSRVFGERDAEQSSIFTDSAVVEQRLREQLPPELKELPLRVDIARHIHRPHTRGPAGGQNFLYDSARGRVRPLTTSELYERLPVSHRIIRIYAKSDDHAPQLAAALDALLGDSGGDDLTNM